jgi:hypothetical protein
VDSGSHLDVLGLKAFDGRSDPLASLRVVPKTPEGQRCIETPGRL